ncbi:nucleotide exchange factor GrpE [Candidatus Marinamargulisbacteria bacterium SCGC AG-439-L15]|nr:nucleotide exchange factor GrpE [Candidatus Marinamargulisbacteria bacterium SCGC AG-439-L15]
MAKNKKKENEKEPQVDQAEEAVTDDQELPQESGTEKESASDVGEDTQEQDLETLKSELAELKEGQDALEASEKEAQEKVLRIHAELENFKKRKEQEKTEFLKFANEKLIMDLLPIVDSFDMAASQVDTVEDETIKSTVEGFLLIQKQLHSLLEKANVTRIVTEGAMFDPQLHQAIGQEDSDDLESNTIIRDVQTGYTIEGRVIRPSMVIVAK